MAPLSTTMKILVVSCFFLAILSSSQANITALCDSADMYWELREDKQVNTFTCTGLAAEDTVRWVLQDATLQYIILGSCPPRLMGGEVVCDSQFSYAPPSRISDNTSEITIDTSRISPSILNGRGRLICSVLNVPGAEGSCRMDYIYPGENISCSVQVTNNTQTVFGQCTVGKIRSSQNRYRCEWIQTRESPSEDILIANTSMTVVPSLRSYFSGRCNFTNHLPPDGPYTYRVTIVPGEVTVNATFIGSSEIFKTTVITSAESSAATTKATTSKAEATTKAAVTTAETREEEITTFETTKTTTAKTASATEEATEAGTTTKEATSTIQMSKEASTTTAANDYATRDIRGTTVTNTVLLGQRCQERCSSCKRVKVQLELVSGPVSYPSDTQSFSFTNSGY